MIAAAESDAARTIGQGEAQAARIANEAQAADPAFYQFLKSLETYRAALDSKTTLVLSADSSFLRLLTQGVLDPARAEARKLADPPERSAWPPRLRRNAAARRSSRRVESTESTAPAPIRASRRSKNHEPTHALDWRPLARRGSRYLATGSRPCSPTRSESSGDSGRFSTSRGSRVCTGDCPGVSTALTGSS